MQIIKNSTWIFRDVDGYLDGKYRVIEVVKEDLIFVFKLDNNSEFKPYVMPFSSFISSIKQQEISPFNYELPFYLSVDEDEISQKHKQIRDKNFKLISGFCSDITFIYEYATNKRSGLLIAQAISKGVSRLKLARLLAQYWRYGQNIYSMLPAYKNSGGKGKDKNASQVPLGAPKVSRTIAIKKSEKFILTNDDKNKIKKSLKKYYLKTDRLSLKKCYEYFLLDNYENEILKSQEEKRAPSIPSLRQFNYWSKKLFTEHDVIIKRITKNDYLKNYRGILGSVIQETNLIGSFFEIDATVADVHIVSELNSSYLLGRPIIYLIVDRTSKMVVGMNVSLHFASWRSARQAIANCFLPKSDYCAQYGIDISDDEWPCNHVPRSLVCDNGEMIGLKPKDIVTPITELIFCPPYRADCKGTVEFTFDILNRDAIHQLIATTKGGQKIRGEADPRKKACYTLNEFTRIVIGSVLKHNLRFNKELAFAFPDLIRNDLSPSPFNVWCMSLKNHNHNLRVSNEDEIISRLMPPDTVSMTKYGISYGELYYSNSEIEQLNLSCIARTNGQWTLDARIDETTTNYIYVKLDNNRGFTKCYLTNKRKGWKDFDRSEIDLLHDWIDKEENQNSFTDRCVEEHKDKKIIEKTAQQRFKENNVPYSEKSKNIRQRREEEIEKTTNTISTKKVELTEKKNTPSSIQKKAVVLPMGPRRIKK